MWHELPQWPQWNHCFTQFLTYWTFCVVFIFVLIVLSFLAAFKLALLPKFTDYKAKRSAEQHGVSLVVPGKVCSCQKQGLIPFHAATWSHGKHTSTWTDRSWLPETKQILRFCVKRLPHSLLVLWLHERQRWWQ